MPLKHHRIIKFIVSGGSAAAIEYGAFVALTFLLLPVVAANVLSFICGLIVSFTLNKAWVFSSKGKGGRQFALYLGLALTNMLLSSILIFLLVEQLHILSYIAKIIVMGMVAIWNYGLFSRIIFKSGVKSDPDDGSQV